MATLGRYEILQTLSDDGLVAVCAARPASRPDAPTVRLVTYRPPKALTAHPRTAIERSAFVESFKRQQQLASTAGDAWARVTEIARDGEATYIIVDHPPASLEDLIRGRVALPANTLRHLVAGVVRALVATQKADALPHGALTAGCVLIDLNRPLDETSVRLSDPAPPLTAEAFDAKSDRRRLGQLILQLVDPQPTWSGVRWPIQPSAAWKRLGRSGDAWRELVNRLLDPNAEQRGTGIALEQLEAQLPVEPRNLKKPLSLATAAAILAIGGGATYWNFFYVPALTDAQIEPTRQALTHLYWEHWWWFTAFHDPIRQGGRDPFAEFRGAAATAEPMRYLDERILQPLRAVMEAERGLSFKPGPYFDNQQDYANISASQIATLDVPELRQNIDQSELAQINVALEAIDSVRSALENWPLRNRLIELAREYEARGWTGAAEEAERLAAGVLSPPSPVDVAGSFSEVDQRDVLAGMTALMRAAPVVAQIDSILLALQRIDEKARAIGLTVPQALGPWLNDYAGGAASLGELQQDLRSVESIVQQMDAIFAEPDGVYAWEIFDTEVGGAPSVPTTADAEYFNEWLTTARQYRAMTNDPRMSIRASLGDWTIEMTDFIKRIDLFTRDEADRLTSARVTLSGEVQALLDRSAIEKNRAEIESQVDAMATRMETLRSQAELITRSLERPADVYVAELREVSFTSAALNALWQERLAEPNLVPTLAARLDAYGAFYRSSEAIRAAFTELSDRRFASPRELPAETDGWQPGVIASLIEQTRETHRATVGRALITTSEASGAGMVATLDTPAVNGVLLREEASFADWFNRVAMFGDDMVRLEELLDAGATLGESVAGDATPRSVRDDWFNGEHAALATNLQPAATEILSRLDIAEQLQRLDDAPQILAMLSGSSPGEFAARWWTAWQRLGDLPFGPTHTLATQRQVLDELQAWLRDAELTDARRTLLRNRLETSSAARWLSFVRALTEPAAFEAAIAERAAFAVRDADLPEWLRWNIRLSALRNDLRPMGDNGAMDDQAKDALRTFLLEAQSVAGSANSRPDASALRNEIDVIINDREETVDFTKIGPTTIEGDRWYFDAAASDAINGDRPPERIVYRMRKQQRSDPDNLSIEFILLHKSEFSNLPGSIYVSINEVSFNLFWQTVKHPAVWSAVDGHLDATARGSTDGRPGPRVWVRSASGNLLTSPPHWLTYDPSRDPEQRGAAGDRTYPAGETPAAPTGDHPMQYVSPQAAFFVARRLGCRLPTTEEMRAAAAKAYGPGGFDGVQQQVRAGSPPQPVPNLRDETFARQAEHARDYRASQGNRPGVFTPEMGAYQARSQDLDTYPIADGTLWFHEVDEGDSRPVRHIVGNVAEWVYDRPDDIVGDDPLRVPAPTEVLSRMVGDQLRIMGGSALSSPNMLPGEPQSIDLGAFMIDERKGFADVGFRLVLVPGRLTTIAQHILQKSDQAFLTDPGSTGGQP